MTTRHHAYLVVLESDVREDDAEPIINALRMVRRVASVVPADTGSNFDIAIARARLMTDVRRRLLQALETTEEGSDG